jgi:hypothetical protein
MEIIDTNMHIYMNKVFQLKSIRKDALYYFSKKIFFLPSLEFSVALLLVCSILQLLNFYTWFIILHISKGEDIQAQLSKTNATTSA